MNVVSWRQLVDISHRDLVRNVVNSSVIVQNVGEIQAEGQGSLLSTREQHRCGDNAKRSMRLVPTT